MAMTGYLHKIVDHKVLAEPKDALYAPKGSAERYVERRKREVKDKLKEKAKAIKYRYKVDNLFLESQMQDFHYLKSKGEFVAPGKRLGNTSYVASTESHKATAKRYIPKEPQPEVEILEKP
jgi:hypothetical protein